MALASPTTDGPLRDRVDAVGAAPCAFLFAEDGGEFPTAATEAWGNERVAWIDPDRLSGYRYFGVVKR